MSRPRQPGLRQFFLFFQILTIDGTNGKAMKNFWWYFLQIKELQPWSAGLKAISWGNSALSFSSYISMSWTLRLFLKLQNYISWSFPRTDHIPIQCISLVTIFVFLLGYAALETPYNITFFFAVFVCKEDQLWDNWKQLR